MTSWMVGIDIGGTFTDVSALNGATGEVVIAKVPSVPSDPSEAVMNGLARLRERDASIEPARIAFFAHGTTVATNALLEEKGTDAGFIINRGLNAVYELRAGPRLQGTDLVDIYYQKPRLLVPQKNTIGIEGRIGFDGREIRPLDEPAVREAARRFKERGIRSVAVCLLFSFMNDAHENRIAAIFGEEYPECRLSLSSRILPTIREYPRMSTTVLDAYIGPIVEAYFRKLEGRLRDAELRSSQVYVMQSNGGLMRLSLASQYPNQTLLSGPAAGVVFGASVGRASGRRNLVTFDMGGTSTDISVLIDGTFAETREGNINKHHIATPMLEINTLGAGGSTIASIGPDGLLNVGPESAGADPGPACYARGGTRPTVTDANMVLGYLSADGLLGGAMRADEALSEGAIQTVVAEPLGLSLREAAAGIRRLVNTKMEIGLRVSLVERGLDPRQSALVAFGGSGPLHAASIAARVGIPRVVVPPFPGISCAMGLLQTDVKHHYFQGHLRRLTAFPPAELEALFDRLVQRAIEEAKIEGLDVAALQFQRQLDVRYPHQGYELSVPCPSGPIDAATIAELRLAFDRLHERVYGVCAPDEQPEVVNVRLISTSVLPHLDFAQAEPGGPSAAAAVSGRRTVVDEETGTEQSATLYDRAKLRPGNRFEGPAIVTQMDSTTFVPAGQHAWVDPVGNLIIDNDAGDAK
jgi:N-methylhydantoinase A